MEPLLSNWLIW